jgi:hypothetical protein
MPSGAVFCKGKPLYYLTFETLWDFLAILERQKLK